MRPQECSLVKQVPVPVSAAARDIIARPLAAPGLMKDRGRVLENAAQLLRARAAIFLGLGVRVRMDGGSVSGRHR
jgi:hypothetical protein